MFIFDLKPMAYQKSVPAGPENTDAVEVVVILCTTAEQPLLEKLLQNVINHILFRIFILQLQIAGHLCVTSSLLL